MKVIKMQIDVVGTRIYIYTFICLKMNMHIYIRIHGNMYIYGNRDLYEIDKNTD
jgi:hypothetical protein